MRAPDHKLVVKAKHEGHDGKVIWLAVGNISLWVNKDERRLEGKMTLNHLPGMTFNLFDFESREQAKQDKT